MQENRLQTMYGIRCFGKSVFMLKVVSMCMYICVSVNQSAYFPVLITLQSYFQIIICLLFPVFKDTHIIQ